MAAYSAASASAKPATAFSCVRCFDRKVKCDKQQPCSACVRHNAECIFRVPPPPRRRRKRAQEEILSEKVKRYESLLQQQGIDPKSASKERTVDAAAADAADAADESANVPSASPSSDHDTHAIPSLASNVIGDFIQSQLLYDRARSKFVDNGLWTSVVQDIHDVDALDSSSGEESGDDELADDNIEFAVGITPSSNSTRLSHPPVAQILEFWQIFLENVNPVIMIVHVPTMQASIQKAISNICSLPKGLEALMFTIYTIAIVSLDNDSCEERFGEPRKTILSRYRSLSRQALARAKFMSTQNLVVLQAFVLYIFSTREVYDPRTIWVMVGMLERIGEGMGLHVDGTQLGLPPFETEIRRRVWAQMKMLHYHSSEQSGASKSLDPFQDPRTTQPPLNVNDDQLYPGMTELPTPSEGITDMLFPAMRAEFARFWMAHAAKQRAKHSADTNLWENYTSKNSIAEKDQAIDELRVIMETKWIRYCDPTSPIQLMTSIVARIATTFMRLIAHHPRRWGNEENVPESEKQLVWDLSTKLLEALLMCRSSKQLNRFAWHTNVHFPWHGLIHVLERLRVEPLMPQSLATWKMIEETYKNNPSWIWDTKKPIHIAIGNLCLKAYASREAALAKEGKSMARAPDYIVKLRWQREAANARRKEREAKMRNRADANGMELSAFNHVTYHEKHLTPGSQPSASSDQSTPAVQTTTTSSPRLTIGESVNSNNAPSSTDQGFSLASSSLTPATPMGNSNNNNNNKNTTGAFWFDTDFDANRAGSTAYPEDPMNLDIDFMLAQGGTIDDAAAHSIDWSQWDSILGTNTNTGAGVVPGVNAAPMVVGGGGGGQGGSAPSGNPYQMTYGNMSTHTGSSIEGIMLSHAPPAASMFNFQ